MITQIGTPNFKTLKTDINEINDVIKLLGGHMTPKLGRYVGKQQESLSVNTIDFTSNFGNYKPINVKTRDGSTVTLKGIATFDLITVQEHYVLKDIDRDFVYRQLKAICEAEVIRHYESDVKQSSETVNKIKYNMERVGISVKDFESEVR